MLWTLLRQYARPYLGRIILVVVLQLATVVAMLYLPGLNARIIDDGVATGDTEFIWSTGAIMLGITGIQIITAIAAVWFSAQTAMSMGRDIRAAVFKKVSGFSINQMSDFGPATLITRGTNDVQQIQMLVLAGLSFMVMAPLMGGGGIVMAYREDPGLTWLMWVTIPLLLLLMGVVLRKIVPYFRQNQEAIDDINQVLREQIHGVRVVRAFVREHHEADRFDGANRRFADLGLRIGRLFALTFPAINLIMHVATAAVLWFGAQRVAENAVMVGSLTAFMQYLLQILMAVMMGMFMFMILPRAIISARRITEVLAASQPAAISVSETPESADPPTQKQGVQPESVGVEFDRVSFSFPAAQAPVLHDISFTAEPGATTAIIGSTGSGKSTILNLISGLQQATSGTVTIGGVDVTQIPGRELSDTVSMVPQKAYLFSGTVATNLSFGAPDATDEQLWEALRTAQAADFVAERGGLDSTIAQGGTDVSGGQRQRLCIARALVAQPKIYLFDDSFSALDVTTDARLRAALAQTTQTTGATVITVAQRVATIKDADKIIVLDDGEVVGQGTHTQLLADCEVYQQIADSQLTGAES